MGGGYKRMPGGCVSVSAWEHREPVCVRDTHIPSFPEDMTCHCPKKSDGAHNMEADSDFSEESSRLASFANLPSTCPISAATLARAGFFYTGVEDRAECFSCKAIVEGWQHGDSAIGKHRKISPNCKFINAFNARSENVQTQAPVSQNLGPHLGYNCATYDLGQSSNCNFDTDFLLKTGRVVDESEPNFPQYLSMCSEEARLKTFKNWPCYVRQTPKELASAGLFYTGKNDMVKCFCCGGKLMNWEPSDVAWTEHRKHFPDCFFVLGRDVGNVTAEPGSRTRRDSEVPENPAMSQVKARLESFANWAYAVNKEALAKAGFYSTGDRDSARCFYCGGELKDWKVRDDPWELHARWYPGCKFLVDEKGQHFINTVQLTRPMPSWPESDIPPALPEENNIEEKLRKLEEEKICKVCMDKAVCIVFIPCGHLVVCVDCAGVLDKCPICCTIIERRQRIFMS
ncbi:E3 ubiquitin-protein ligase XIAP isoform X5 [Dendrobates tinctorius]|uniref:E3 ubiquitin-protein ligase XIAP isoform X5 n=1 Tax=Dendrobates tinctorius TaxID=92724 RepID=UPI003CC9BA58